jgi:hypothetical protein
MTEDNQYIPQDGRYVAGDSVTIEDTVYQSSAKSTRKDISGATITFGLSRYEGSPPLVEKTTSDGVTITDGPDGELAVDIDPTDTEDLGSPHGEEYHFEIEVDDGTDESTVTTGTWVIHSDTV